MFLLLISEKKPISGFDVPTGSVKIHYAIVRVELYITPKFHANRSTCLGGDSFAVTCRFRQHVRAIWARLTLVIDRVIYFLSKLVIITSEVIIFLQCIF